MTNATDYMETILSVHPLTIEVTDANIVAKSSLRQL